MRGRLKKLLCAGTAMSLVALAWGAGPPADRPASPRSLPTDGLPPFGMLDDSGKLVPIPEAFPAAPEATPAAGQIPSPAVPGISLDLATAAVRAAVDACTKQGYAIAATVIDSAGNPRAALMAEGSRGSIFVAMRKAVAALAFRGPTSGLPAALAADKAQLERLTPVMFIAGGGLPIWRGSELIGAIGSSGAHGRGPIGSQDEQCSRAGLDRIRDQLGHDPGK